MPTYRIDLEYHGNRYRGWQAQKNAPSVAAAVETACRRVWRDVRDLHGAGRTDAGVHALQQVAHLRCGGPIKARGNPKLALNDALPGDIAAHRVDEVSDEFHARRSAKERIYLYQICTRRSAFGSDLAWWVKDRLDVKAMREAAKAIEGKRDFTAFCDVDPEKPKSNTVDLRPIEFVEDGPMLVLRFRAPSFLWKMVRRVTGCMVEVGRGRIKAAQVPSLFSQASSVMAPYTAQPQGLYLERVLYEGERYVEPLRPVLRLPR